MPRRKKELQPFSRPSGPRPTGPVELPATAKSHPKASLLCSHQLCSAPAIFRQQLLAIANRNDSPDLRYQLISIHTWCKAKGVEMAASRHTSAMLARMTMASPSPILATRAFSTALPLRIAYNQSSFKPRGPVRSNPLVGNYAPAEPAEPAEPVQPLQHKTTPDSDSMPPPPPPSSAAPAIPEPAEKQTHAYDAVARPNITIDLASIVSEKASTYAYNRGATNPMDKPKVRAKAVSGRTVFIQDRLSPTSAPTPMVALRVLEKMCRDQKIKNKFHSQKFHERKGLKKKRLRSQRWRARFKTGFKAAVNRVMELKKQGW